MLCTSVGMPAPQGGAIVFTSDTLPHSLYVPHPRTSAQGCDEDLRKQGVSAEQLTDLLFIACVEGSYQTLVQLIAYDNAKTHVLGVCGEAGSGGRQGKKAQQQQQQQQGQLLEQLLMTCVGCHSPRFETCVRTLIDAAPAVQFLSECLQPAE